MSANDVPEIKIHLSPGARMPTRATDGSAGWDLYAAERSNLQSGSGTDSISTGVRISLPPGWEAQIRPRSSLSLKGVSCAFGTIDEDYRGELRVILSFQSEYLYDPADGGYSRGWYCIEAGDRIAQLAFRRVPTVRLAEVASVEELGETARGSGGFGSSGR